MSRTLSRTALAAAVGAALLLPAGASAAPFGALGTRSLDAAQPKATEIQHRRGYHRGGHRHGHRHWHGHRGGVGPGLALGLATGAIIGGAIAAQQAPVYSAPAYAGDADAYCASRFRSYDPASGTYLGYDGLRHPCP